MTGTVEQTIDPLWAVWRDVVQQFRLRRLIRDLLGSRSGWGFYGVDVVTTLRGLPMTQDALRLLADVSAKDLDRLVLLAGINARRNEALWRMAALFYVTVPVTLFLAGLEGAPEVTKLIVSTSGVGIGVTVALLTLWLLVYFGNQWAARQVEAVVELARIERGAA